MCFGSRSGKSRTWVEGVSMILKGKTFPGTVCIQVLGSIWFQGWKDRRYVPCNSILRYSSAIAPRCDGSTIRILITTVIIGSVGSRDKCGAKFRDFFYLPDATSIYIWRLTVIFISRLLLARVEKLAIHHDIFSNPLPGNAASHKLVSTTLFDTISVSNQFDHYIHSQLNNDTNQERRRSPQACSMYF